MTRRLALFLVRVAAVFVMVLSLSTLAFAGEGSLEPTGRGLLVALVSTVGAAAVSLFTTLVKNLLPNIPRALIPTVILPTLGVLATWIAAIPLGGFDPVVGAFITLGALYARETLDTVKEHGLDPVGKS